jgi:hypothetical protein
VPTFARQTFPTTLDSVLRAKAPSFDSPADTWRVFLGGIEAGDREAVSACLTPSALDRLGADGEPVPLSELQEIVSSFVRIEDEGYLGPFWSIYGVRAKQRPKWIFFEKTDRGEWKISGI